MVAGFARNRIPKGGTWLAGHYRLPFPTAMPLDPSTLIARTTAATDGTDQLAAFDQWPTAGRGDQRRIERRHVWMSSLERVVESARLTTVTRRSAGFALGNADRGKLCTVHAREVDKVAVGIASSRPRRQNQR